MINDYDGPTRARYASESALCQCPSLKLVAVGDVTCKTRTPAESSDREQVQVLNDRDTLTRRTCMRIIMPVTNNCQWSVTVVRVLGVRHPNPGPVRLDRRVRLGANW